MHHLLAVLLLAAACSAGTKAPTPPPSNTPGGEGGHVTCTTDADCVIVETACCDHCNGGKAEAFNAAFADTYKPSGCEQTACTKMGCGNAIASCDRGTCKATIAPL